MKTDWEVKKLGDVCEIKPPKREARNKLKETDVVSFAPMEDLGINQKFLNPTKERTLKEVEGSYTYFANDDVLLAKITPCFENGKLGIAKNLKNGIGFGSSEYIVFRTNENLFPEYLYYFLLRPQFIEEGAKRMTGAVGHKRVSKEFIESCTISFPPLPEQKRIVAILDEAFESIAKAKENAEKNLKNAKEIFESYLQSVFENKGEGWEECNLEEYIKLIDYRGRTPVKTETGVRLITAKNVKLGYLELEPQEFINENNYDSWMTRGIPNFGDVIFTTEAPLANVAQINTTEKLAFAQRIIVMQPQTNKIDQTFLKYMLVSNPIRTKILEKGTGATVQGIKSRLLKKIQICIPKTITEQQSIVAKLDALSTETKKLETIYEKKLADLEELKKSILAKAFNGELTEALA